MNQRERHRVEALERRVLWVEKALADWRGGDQGRARSEVAALRWVLRVLESDPERTLAEILVSVRQSEREMSVAEPGTEQ